MNDRWFYAKDKKKHGPVTRAELQALLARGELLPSDMVLEEGTPRWILASSVIEPPPLVVLDRPAPVPNSGQRWYAGALAGLREVPRAFQAAFAQVGRLFAYWGSRRETARAERLARAARVDLGRGMFNAELGDPDVRRQVVAVEETLRIIRESRGSAGKVQRERDELLLRLSGPWVSPDAALPGLEAEQQRAIQAEQARADQQAILTRARYELFPEQRAERTRVWAGSGVMVALLVGCVLLLLPRSTPADRGGEVVAAAIPKAKNDTPPKSDRQPPPVELKKLADTPMPVTPLEKKTLKQLFKLLAPAVPMVETLGAGGGSGFLVRHEGRYLVVTNRHVIEHARHGLELYFLRSVKGGQEERLKIPPAKVKVTAVHRTVDMALLDVSAAAAELEEWKIQPVTLAPKDHELEIGEHVFAIGHPGDASGGVLTRTLSDGIVSAVNRKIGFSPVGFTQVTVPINPGNSGGPIFNDAGKVIAIATLTIRRSKQREVTLEALNFGVDTRYVHELLNDPTQSLSQADIAAQFGAGEVQLVGTELFKIQGFVQGGDPTVTAILPGKQWRVPAKTYSVKLKGGVMYRLDMVSDDFDPLLVIQDAGGKQLAYDHAGALDALLHFTPPSDGQYKVFAASSLGLGKFLLAIREVGAGQAAPVDLTVYSVPKEGLKIEENVGDKDRLVLVRPDPNASGGFPVRAKPFQVKLEGGKTYRFHMASAEFDTYLIIHDAAGKQLAFDDDSGGGVKGLDAQIDFTAPADGTYQVFAASFAGHGKFTLTARQDNSLAKDIGKIQKEAQQQLQGAWKSTQSEVGGLRVDVPADKVLQLTFTADKFTMIGGRNGKQEGTYTFDAAKNPKQIALTATFGGVSDTAQAIFEVDGDTLRLAFSTQDVRSRRPTGFRDPRAVIMVFRRER